MKAFQDKDLQSFIGNLLRIGVIIAMSIVVIGLFIYLFQHSSEQVNYGSFSGHSVFNYHGFIQGLSHGESGAIMELGVIVLIAIPIARVLFTMLGFLMERDIMYTIIAFIVLCIISFSLIYGISTH